jgi:hypothetical protein
MSRELSEVRRQKTPRPRKERERCVRSMQRITLDNSIARNRGRGSCYGESICEVPLI